MLAECLFLRCNQNTKTMEQKEFKVGDKVCLLGTVTDVVDAHRYPVKVKFLTGENESYTPEGLYSERHSIKELSHYPDVAAMQAEIDEYRRQLEAAHAEIERQKERNNRQIENAEIAIGVAQTTANGASDALQSANEEHANEEHANIIALKDAEINTLQIQKRLLINLLTIKFRHQ